MKKQVFIYWLPRVIAVLFIVFISLFALDVFDQSSWFLALLIHLIPSFVLVLLTLVAWRNERLGGYLFLGTSVLAAFFFHSLLMTAPTFFIGLLFLISKKIRHE
jgi:hypothetical protein